ncbi:hypothetical protein MCO_00862 [Bartonella sp. DB5-6]|nr:hypothetical protein MCO_00862 [Bartonella sp. DB5-6]
MRFNNLIECIAYLEVLISLQRDKTLRMGSVLSSTAAFLSILVRAR